MEFKRVCRALYRYEAVEAGELSFDEDALIYIWDDSNDEWWRASLEMAQNESELVTGLVPYNYVEEMEHLCKARALHDYEALNNDELSFGEGAEFLVYQKDGEDWMMVNYNGVFGFIPQSYVEEFSEDNFEDQGYVEPPRLDEESVQFKPANTPYREPTPTTTISVEPVEVKKNLKEDMVYWRVSEVDKKKKSKKKVRLGLSADTFYVASEDNKSAPIREWSVSALATYGIKNKHVLIEISGEDAIAFDFSCSSIKQAEAIAFKIRSCSKARFNEKPVKSSGLFGMFKKKQSKPKAPPSGKGRTTEARNVNHLATLKEKNSTSPLPALPTTVDRDSSHGKSADPSRHSTFEDVVSAPPKTVSNPAASKPPKRNEGDIAVVLYNFVSVEEDELSVQADERIYVIDRSDSAWWVCRVYYDDGQYKDGLVPSDYVSPLAAEAQAPASKPTLNTSVAAPEPAAPKPALSTKDASGPNPDRLREWTDATGSFKVEAELIKYLDGKIHLHKTNGVKIAVPLEKMSAIDVHYVSEVIGQDLSTNFEAAKKERAEVTKWKEFLAEAGVSPSDAATYANKLTHEKIDRMLLRDMDRPTLKGLGFTEGDALRVEKAFQRAKAAEEDEALAQRLQQEEVERLRKEAGGNLREYQIEQDAMLARKLQQEADATGSWQNFNTKANESRNQKYGLGLGNKTGRPTKGVDPSALFEASAKLQEENLKEGPKPMTKIATKKSTPKSGFTDDIWAVPGDKPVPKPLLFPNPSGIPQLQSKSWDAFGNQSKESLVFSRKDASRASSKPSEIEEKWGFVQANFENQAVTKPPEPAPSLKPAGPLAQPLIPVPRGGNSNVFVPTRRPPPPKPVTNVFADNPTASPNISGAGVTTRVAPKQDNLFHAASNMAQPPNNSMGFSSRLSNPLPKTDMFAYNEAPFNGAMSTGFVDNAFARNGFGNQTSTTKPPTSNYQFDDLSLESLGLKPIISKAEARPHSAMGLQYPQQESTSSFADFSHRPGNLYAYTPPASNSIASYTPALNKSTESFTRDDFKPPTHSANVNDYQVQFSSHLPSPSNYYSTSSRATAGGLNSSNPTSSFAGSNPIQGGGYTSNSNQDMGFSGTSLGQTFSGSILSSTFSSSSLNFPGNNPSQPFSATNQSYSRNPMHQSNFPNSLHQNYPGSNLPSSNFPSSLASNNLNQSYSANSLAQMGGYNNQPTGFASTSFLGGYPSNLGQQDFGSLNMPNLGNPTGMNNTPQTQTSAYSAFSGVDPLNSGNPYPNQQHYPPSQPSRFYPN